MKNLTQNLGLCRKAGALIIGFDAVAEVLKKGKAAGVLTASDVSDKTLKEIKFHAERYKVQVLPLPAVMDELKSVTGKRAGILAITDEGLFSLFI